MGAGSFSETLVRVI